MRVWFGERREEEEEEGYDRLQLRILKMKRNLLCIIVEGGREDRAGSTHRHSREREREVCSLLSSSGLIPARSPSEHLKALAFSKLVLRYIYRWVGNARRYLRT